jgi:hypothetical protein
MMAKPRAFPSLRGGEVDAQNLDVLLLKGPPAGDLEAGLDQLRHAILSHGIPANSDGMVCDAAFTPTYSRYQLIHSRPV